MTFIHRNKKRLNKYLIFALILAIINLIALFIIFGLAKNTNEVPSVLNVMHWMAGMEYIMGYGFEDLAFQIFRPLSPLLALPFKNIGEEVGFLVQTIAFYLLSIYFIFKITELIYKSRKQALFASILFAFAIPVLRESLSSYTMNIGSWFFCIFSVYLTLLYLKNQDEKLVFFNGLISGLGVLMKENGGLGILFFVVAILLSRKFNLKEKFLKIIKFGLMFSTPIIIWEVIVAILTPFSRLNFLARVKKDEIDEGPSKILRVLHYVLALFTTFGLLGWVLILWGALKEWKNKNKERIRILLALVPFSLISLAWPRPCYRHAFIIGTLGVLLGSYALIGLKNLFKNKKIGLLLITIILILYVVFNYYSYYVNDSLPFIDFENILHFFEKI